VLSRADAIRAMAGEIFDVVVVGGGITGAGVALDAATRGCSVALVERADFAAGTSSRSSKLVHGGLRYLQQFDVGLVREALLERQLLAALAPHLVRPLAFVVPAFGGARPDRLLGLGLNMYDVLAVDRGRRRRGREAEDWSPERHRVIGGDEVVQRLPALAARAPTSGYLFYDCQTDDARLVLTVLAEAERYGAVPANRAEVVGLLDGGGRAAGVRVRDTETGESLEVRARAVVNATGVWADRLRPDELHGEAELPTIRPSRGTHLLLAHATLPVDDGVIVPAGDGRTVFVLPWLGQTLVGTTDRDHAGGGLEHVRPAEDDVGYLLDAVNGFFETALGPGDVAGAYAGVRPLIATGDPRKSVDISRRAELYETSSGMVTITGGKLTTWRRMAKMTVDRLMERAGREAPCRTHEVPLGLAVAPDTLPRVDGVPDAGYARLAGRYGAAAHEVLRVAAERGELAQPILPGHPDLLAEAAWAARREQARSVGDVLLRRTRLGLLDARALLDGDGPVARVAAVMGAELGWDAARAGAAADAFRDEAAAEGLVV
jgi:glycerol-3-phosphate dehydrogenase